jgi:hypothetical protein
MSARSDDEELADLLDELETTLSDLRAELDSEGTDGRRGRRDSSGPRPPRPPSMSDLLRFTEEYTIPAIVTILEANVRALKATQRVLRMADPERAARAESSNARDRLDDAGRTALSQLERSLTDLSNALSSADLPADPESRDIVEDARSLTDEIEDRIADAQERREGRERGRAGVDGREESGGSRRGGRDPDARRDRRDRGGRREDARDRGVTIDVTEEGEEPESGPDDGSDEPGAAAESAQDVEAELQSIKDELGQNGESDGSDDAEDDDR